MHQSLSLTSFVVALTASAALAGPRVIITEIMYNPASDEKQGESEWVEIANVGDEAVEMKGWKLDHAGPRKWGTFDATLRPGGVAVLVNAAAVNEAEFRAAWDAEASGAGNTPSYQVIAVKWGVLPNQASGDKEVLQLLDDAGKVVCEVNYQTNGEWPGLTMAGGSSIWLTDVKATNLSQGTLWKASKDGQDGARRCKASKVFNGPDIGSPGVITSSTPPRPRDPASPDSQGGKPAAPSTPSDDKPAKDAPKQDSDKVPF